jgi:arylsulfatase A-like enzyme
VNPAGRSDGAADSAAAAAPPIRSWERWLASWGLLALGVVPLTILQQIDALLMYATPMDVLRDFALLVLLSGLPATALVLLALASKHLLRAVRGRDGTSTLLLDAIALMPALWMLLWQLSRIAWLWVKQATGHDALVSPPLRYTVMVVLLLIMFAGWRFVDRSRWQARLIEHVRALKKPLVVTLLAALALLFLSPPQLADSAPAPAVDAASRPNIVLITVDALSAIDANVCGDSPTPMPQLRAFARQATCYTHLYAASNFTTPTTSTLETGLLPWSHLATQLTAKVAEPLQSHTLARALHDAGYATYTTTDNHLASVRQRATQSGYLAHAISPSRLLRDRLRAALSIWPQSSVPMLVDNGLSFLGAFDTLIYAERNPFDSGAVLGRVPEFLAANGGRRPAFVWVHSMPPHSPYLPPPATKYKLLPQGELDRWADFMGDNVPYAEAQQPRVDKHRLRYRESIMATDMALGQLLARLERDGVMENSLVIISADHGESFEKGFLGHAGPKLHEAVIRVPLIVMAPGQRQGRIVETPISQADIAPSVLDWLGLPALIRTDGRSLAASWRGEPIEAVPLFSMSMERQSRFRPLKVGHFAVIDGPLKLIVNLQQPQSAQLFDLAQDPLEQVDVSAKRREDVARLSALLHRQLELAEGRRAPSAAP